ncbi:LLM class F420-dependent oxidoreductase [Modestobacter sp. I12A-02628]|uniref:LLM class F420-dependent oxidoreductase n=1 Tax=Goekera deserti TaxID=2497753 RepID=A0A7K3WI17_9ACTN|nr:LLM class F420-dependent oxidoreductase [Goekera deserti]MPQ97810.1 LLM class F420-dependent oxidoreductase [Goekera deserti]NDI48455.1 LLM class F420-dependent oxidoreductase [Goekera deserti]NEL56057.1 LLM class F420-dependent oxidoreductase [Goekera deserti]
MRLGLQLDYSGGFTEAVAELRDLESAGLDTVFVPEAYSFDAVSQLGYLAAVTERVELASCILPIYSRTPALTAMTAAGLDFVSDGRFTLGLGASGPQVVEGWHGVAYDAPLGRTREVVEICRQVWRRERLEHDGPRYTVPLPAGRGTGLGKPLKLINHPVRERIPVLLAAIGPKNVELAAEIADVWQPVFFHPGKAAGVWGEALAAGAAVRDPALGPLQTAVTVTVAIGDDVEELRHRARPSMALYIGGMGARGKNFYNELACRYGYEEAAREVQDLYLAGRKDEAAARLPDELVRAVTIVGPEGHVAERVAAFAEAGVTTLSLSVAGGGREERLRTVETLRRLVP